MASTGKRLTQYWEGKTLKEQERLRYERYYMTMKKTGQDTGKKFEELDEKTMDEVETILRGART